MTLVKTRVFVALALAALAFAGCAGGQKQTADPASTPPAKGGQQPAPYDGNWASAPGQASPTAQAASSTPGTQATSAPSLQAGAPAKTPASSTGAPAETPTGAPAPSAVRQLLTTAGRTPDAPQPEAGFVLEVPDSVATGRPFLVRMGYAGVQSAQVEWRGRVLNLVPDAGGICQALLAEPLKKEAESRPLKISLSAGGKTETMSAELKVVEPKFPVQRLSVDPKFVNPPKSELERIKRNQQAVRDAVSKFSPERSWNIPLYRPVPGVVTSLFGVRRVFNGEERGRHRGVDFDAETGDPIQAVDAGKVVLAEEQYYGGNTIIVDHGLGVFSMYLHLSAINVAVGQQVTRGETVGLAGRTGRVTGPHLHLSFYVGGESVDASPLIQGM